MNITGKRYFLTTIFLGDELTIIVEFNRVKISATSIKAHMKEEWRKQYTERTISPLKKLKS